MKECFFWRFWSWIQEGRSRSWKTMCSRRLPLHRNITAIWSGWITSRSRALWAHCHWQITWSRFRGEWPHPVRLFLCHSPLRSFSREGMRHCIMVWMRFPTIWSWWTERNWKIRMHWSLVHRDPASHFLQRERLPTVFWLRMMTLSSRIRSQSILRWLQGSVVRLSGSVRHPTSTSTLWTSIWTIRMTTIRLHWKQILSCPYVSWSSGIRMVCVR